MSKSESVLEFSLDEIFEKCSINTIDDVIAKNVEYALNKQYGIVSNIVILPSCQSTHCEGKTYNVTALFEVFADDHNTVIAKGLVNAQFFVVDEKAFEKYDLKCLELVCISGYFIRT